MARLTTSKYIKKLKTLTILKQNLIEERKKFKAYYKTEPDYCTCHIDGTLEDCDACFDIGCYNLVIGCIKARKEKLKERFEDEQAR